VTGKKSAGGGGQFAVKEIVSTRIEKCRSGMERGFSLLELMISMFILIILLSAAIPTYQRSVQHAEETVLKENLWQMRRAIDQYSTDKGKLPKSLDDLVESKYLKERPVDPTTQKSEWKEITGPDPNLAEGEEGLVDIRSTNEAQDSEGVPYSDYGSTNNSSSN
jgi:general secretion pathway protein G